MPTDKPAILVFPNQLFEAILEHDTNSVILLIEDDLFFTQYRFHKQKLVLHRASMLAFKQRLEVIGFMVEHITTAQQASMESLQAVIKQHNISRITYYDVVDDWLQQRLSKLVTKLKLPFEILSSPAFLTTRGAIEDYFSSMPNRMQSFYQWQRKRLDVLVTNGKPVGGKWSFDTSNRKPLPKNITLPPPYHFTADSLVQQAQSWVNKHFANNPGDVASFNYPTTHAQAHDVLEQFLKQRLVCFGPYEDAISSDQSQLYHSILSPLLNTGLLTPRQVVTRTLQYADQHNVPIESLEGFIRQIIGWREYMRATYVQFGRDMRSQNKLQHSRKLNKAWWDGSTGLMPVDRVIGSLHKTAYAHHIERLMVLGNAMLLLRINPDEVYEWFMCFFIDSYDWVMVPNVYAMSQFAPGDIITTKPYISGSNYLIKMSDYTKADWSDAWDALYWRFVADHRDVFAANYRSAIMVKLYDKLPAAKKSVVTRLSNQWLQ